MKKRLRKKLYRNEVIKKPKNKLRPVPQVKNRSGKLLSDIIIEQREEAEKIKLHVIKQK